MKILALEFSSEQRSVAVLQSPAGGGPSVPSVATFQSSPRTLNAFHLIETVLCQHEVEREEIECIAIGLGPGSYTGIRAAISIAQAWQLARGVRLLGLSSIECLAVRAQAHGIFGRVNLVVDAQRNEFYLATYEIDSARLRPIEALRLAAVSEVAARAKAGEMLVGPEVDRWFAPAKVLFPEAGALATLAAGRTDFVSGQKLEPIYLRETTFVKAPPRQILPND